MSENRRLSIERANELKTRITDYIEARQTIRSGLDISASIALNKAKILGVLGGTEDDWDNWRWQMDNRISETEVLARCLDLTDDEARTIEKVGEQYRWAISPYYLSLVNPKDRRDPIFRQSVPAVEELDPRGVEDPMSEETTSPTDMVTRRYPDRLIVKVTNQCPMYCRHCQRRRAIGEVDVNTPRKHLTAAVDYIRENPEIRDVLITGGDALMHSNATLDWLLTELDSIPHVEIKRIGTRTLATLPQRVTPELCRMLSKHHPLYINTQFNSPVEVTEEAKKATDMLSRAGIPVGNQAVLLKGINNDPHVMKRLNHELLKIRVLPYYIFHAKSVKGTTHFRCRVEDGMEIMERLRGYTSGMAVPTYIINAPGGLGKTPMLPEYLLNFGKDELLMRTWEGKVVKYKNYEGDDAEN